jgi:uncharacterized protein
VLERGARGALRVDFFEAISENHLVPGGRPRRIVEDVRALAPLALHGVSLNVGSTDPLDLGYLDALAALARRVEATVVSDHLCWTGVRGRNSHDLLPLPHTEEALRHVAARVRAVQERLGRRIALENVSSYVRFAGDELSEWEFLAAVAEAADCEILLDVNNVFVNAWNHGFDADAYLDAMPPGRVAQIHLAGHSESGALLIDTHDHPIRAEVLALYERALRRLGPVATLVEWDDRLPSYEALEAEAGRVRAVLERVRAEQEGRGRGGDGGEEESRGRDGDGGGRTAARRGAAAALAAPRGA